MISRTDTLRWRIGRKVGNDAAETTSSGISLQIRKPETWNVLLPTNREQSEGRYYQAQMSNITGQS